MVIFHGRYVVRCDVNKAVNSDSGCGVALFIGGFLRSKQTTLESTPEQNNLVSSELTTILRTSALEFDCMIVWVKVPISPFQNWTCPKEVPATSVLSLSNNSVQTLVDSFRPLLSMVIRNIDFGRLGIL